MFSLSPLTTAHPPVLQHRSVRPSNVCYHTFSLAMVSSSGFGSASCDLSLYSNSLSLRLPYSVKLAAKRKSLTHYAKGTQSPPYDGSYCLYACGFRIYFTPLPGFFLPFLHSTGSLSVDHEYLVLEDGPPIFRQGFTCPVLLFAFLVPHVPVHVQGYHLLCRAFPDLSIAARAIKC